MTRATSTAAVANSTACLMPTHACSPVPKGMPTAARSTANPWPGCTTRPGVRFEVVSRARTKSGKCRVCGKACTRKERVEQTLNPFNKDANGRVKDYATIVRELNEHLEGWLAEPIVHARCETT